MSWEKVKLGVVTEKPISGEWGDSEGETKILRTTNFNNDGSLNLSNVVERNISTTKIAQKALKIGDSIIEKSGGSPTQPVGRVVYFNVENEVFLCNNFTSVIRPKNEIHPKYLFWFLFNNHLTGNTLKYQNKTTGIINLQLERYLKEIEIPLPPLSTQQKIAAILDKADALRRKDQELLKKYDDLAQAIFIDMFGDPVKNDKGWKVSKIGSMGKVQTGNTPPRAEKKYYGSFIEWIKTDNILLEEIHPKKATEYLSESGLKVGRFVEKGSVLITCIAGSPKTIGNVVLTDRKVAFNQQINSLSPNPNYNSLFIYALFRYCKSIIQDSTTQGMKRIITKSTFENLELISPPLELQNEFEKSYNKFISAKNTLYQQVEKSEALFQSLLQQAFKGN